MHSGFSTVRSRHHPYVQGIARDVRGDEAIPTQPVHEAVREGGYHVFLRVGLSTILVSFRVSTSFMLTFHLVTFLASCPARNQSLTNFPLNKVFNLLYCQRCRHERTGYTYLETPARHD